MLLRFIIIFARLKIGRVSFTCISTFQAPRTYVFRVDFLIEPLNHVIVYISIEWNGSVTGLRLTNRFKFSLKTQFSPTITYLLNTRMSELPFRLLDRWDMVVKKRVNLCLLLGPVTQLPMPGLRVQKWTLRLVCLCQESKNFEKISKTLDRRIELEQSPPPSKNVRYK